MTTPNVDQRALDIAHHIHRLAGARQTFLFGSRLRGDHHSYSDIDLLVITETTPAESCLEDLRRRARQMQKEKMPETSGVDIICMSEPEFIGRVRLRNNFANTIAKEGQPIVPSEEGGCRFEYREEMVDWEDVDRKMQDAIGAADWISAIHQADVIDSGDDRQFGIIARNALEFAYKAVIAAHGYEYPTSGRDGHNLKILAQLMRGPSDHREEPSSAR